MPSIGFTVFKDKVKDGSKRQTIRKVGYRVICPGDTLYLYWHLRQKDCDLLKVVRCKEVLILSFKEFAYNEEIAKLDGFNSSEELRTLMMKMHKPTKDTLFYIIRW